MTIQAAAVMEHPISRQDQVMSDEIKGMSEEQAKAEIEKVMADPASLYWDKYHPDHKLTHEKVTRLFQQVYPPEDDGGPQGLADLLQR
jgi:hypothetical protein